MLRFLYKTVFGRIILKGLVNPNISKAAGAFLDSPLSRFIIKPFIKHNHIDMSDFEVSDYKCFNDFFVRQVKEGVRPLDNEPSSLIAPCDGFLSITDITDLGVVIPIKQSRYTIEELLESRELAEEFKGGKCLVYRLAVDNYHRYCYFDSGIKGANCYIKGVLNTVRPIALSQLPVFVRNSREYTIMHTDNFGAAIQMEVGALLVGRIVNHHDNYSFKRGEEKGYFMYGGSTIVVLLTKDAALIDESIQKRCNRGYEAKVKQGQRVGRSTLSKNGRRLRTFTAMLMCCAFLAGMCTSPVMAAQSDVKSEEAAAGTEGAEAADIEILFTSDVHSYLAPYLTEEDGRTVSVGGMSRVADFVNKKREANPNLLLIDGGDYPMGTLYQTFFAKEAYEYRILSKIGYDATTFGNHDFDYGSKALAEQFDAAKANVAEEDYPYFVTCNVNWDKDNEGTKVIYDSLCDMKLKDYVVLKKGDVTIGITGCLGYDALECAPTCELEVLDPIESVKAAVAKMKAESDPDIIVLISHSGTDEDPDKSEDEKMAKEVPDIDFILSGHTHTVLPEVIKVGDTYIGSCGCYSEYVGDIALAQNESGRYDLVDYKLHRMDESVAEDPEIAEMLKGFDEEINEQYLKAYGYTSDYVVARNSYEFSSVDDLYYVHDDHNLGNLIADAYRWRVNNMDTGDDNEVAAAIAPSGTIRATYPKGGIDIDKVYESFSLGSGADGTVGYPLVSLYITGEELNTVCEIDASISPLMRSANLYLSGVKFEYNPNRAFLNKVTYAKLNGVIGGEELYDIEPDKLYRVVADMYSYRMLGAVEDTSKGLLKIEPKDINGNPITNEEEIIIHDANGNEVKAWVAIANYMESFPEGDDGIAEIPAMYENGAENRKVVNESRSIEENMKNPNRFAVVAYIICAAITALFLFPIIMYVVKSRQRRDTDELNDERDRLIEYLKDKQKKGRE